MSFRFEVRNVGDVYRFLSIEVHDLQMRSRAIKLSLPGIENIGEIEFARGETLTGAIMVPNATGLRRGWTLYLKTPVDVTPAAFKWDEEEDRGPLEQRLMVSMRVSSGFANVDDGIGIDKAAWTASNAFGLQVLYGISKHVTIVGTLDIGRTSAVSFSDAIWDMTPGQLDVQETSGRLLAGGLFHTGQRWIPYGRVAVGARFSERMTSMALRSESEVRASAIFGFGGGLDILLTKRIVAGASLTFVAPFGGSDSSLTAEVGLHVGATWDLDDGWR